ncbi:hypothetical protein B9Z55_019616 [Caenorhabditis nigoni]|uniref:Fork-head domain-containing protein n=1 Tax=Caenorhabditis nigoni TaxID=1611254 RepID=A0A2G5TJ91_9PELO|nr:hypothetical protein B9Z55_019616 [Caenorhabditis nigoni]
MGVLPLVLYLSYLSLRVSVLCSPSSLFIYLHTLFPPSSTFLSSDVWTSFFFFAKPLTTYLFRETLTTSNSLQDIEMDEQDSGMEMMLTAMVAPLDDDLPWQFDDQILKETDTLDSAAQSPSSSLFSDFDDSCTSSFSSSLSSPSFASSSDTGTSSLSSFDMMMSMFPDPAIPTVSEETTMAPPPPVPVRKNVVVRRRPRECSMVCWLFRTLLTSEYRALPVNAIFEIFEETMQQTTAGSGRHYRQSIRHCLMTSAVFVRVLTPNPRKDFLVMNEQGSWWTVHPDCETACAEHVFKSGAVHRCPPQASIPAYFARYSIFLSRCLTYIEFRNKKQSEACPSISYQCNHSHRALSYLFFPHVFLGTLKHIRDLYVS